MTMRSLKFWLSMFVMTSVFLALGGIFDRRCRGGCLREVILMHLDNDAVNDGNGARRTRDGKLIKARIAEPLNVVIEEKARNQLTIKSYVTNWVIRQKKGLTTPRLTVSGYRPPEEWRIEDKDGELKIEMRKRGPRRAELEIPESFSSSLELINVSGEVTFEAPFDLKRIKVTNVSGLVSLQELPREKLELSTVTGSIQVNQRLQDAKTTIEVQSVSGDVDMRLKGEFEHMHVESVSGSVFLRIPESVAFSYKLESVSGNFSGFPPDAEESREFGEKNLEGNIGAPTRTALQFETISGEFQLMQDKMEP